MVAPRAGAWIETFYFKAVMYNAKSPPVRGRGLKHDLIFLKPIQTCRPPCGGVD